MFLFVIEALLLAVGVVFLIVDVRKPKNFPDGPPWLPLVGNYFHLRKRLPVLKCHHLVWQELSREYGKVVGLRLGRNLVVVAFGADAVHEVLTREEFEGRPDGFLFRYRTFGKRLGIVFSDGPFWQNQRKFSLQHLRSFGLGRKEMELSIEEETRELVMLLSGKGNTPVRMEHFFDVAVLNVLWVILAGKRFELDDERLIHLIKLIHDAFKAIDMSGGVLNQLPILRHVAPDASGFTQISTILKTLYEFLEEIIEEHKKTICKSHCRDFIDAYLQNLGKGDAEFTEQQLLSLCLDLLMAGTETTSNTLSFAFMYMLKHPDVQNRVQREIDEVTGGNRLPTLQDKSKLPYTEAVMLEVQRIANVPPLGIAHRATRDTYLQGRYVPEGTVVLTSLHSVHMDEGFWKDPLEFRPERFLNGEGKVETPDKYFLPFGYGKRRCIGESLAKSNYFIIFSSLLYKFTITKDPENEEIDTEALDGFTLSPKPYTAIFNQRFI